MEARVKCFICGGLYQPIYIKDVSIDGMPQPVCLRCMAEIEGNEKKMLAEAGITFRQAEGTDEVVSGSVGEDQGVLRGDPTVPQE